MAYEDIVSAPLGEVRLAGASKGVALTTTAAFTNLPYPTRYIFLTPRNFSTAVVARYYVNPYLVIVKTTDLLATAALATDSSKALQNNPVGTAMSLNSFNTIASNNALYIGAHIPFRGVAVTIGNANATVSVLTVKYWNGTAWTNITATDGTTSGGATMAVAGNVTWTLPTTWVPGVLSSAFANTTGNIGDTTLGTSIQAAKINILGEQKVYWTRWEVSVQLGASVSVTTMSAMNRKTTYDELLSGQTREFRIDQGFGGIGSVEALTDAGTANLLIGCATIGTDSRFEDS